MIEVTSRRMECTLLTSNYSQMPAVVLHPHVDWDYNTNSADGDCLLAWASSNNLAFLHDPKDEPSFYSGRWNTGTNPHLAFTTVGPDSRLPYRRVLEKFPRSQHRSSLITPPRLFLPVPGRPVKRWNFRKANWSHHNSFTNKLARNLPSPDSINVDQAYQDLCNTISKAAKKAIPRGRRNTYIPCWDAKCEALYQTFLQSPAGDQSSRAATALTTWLTRNAEIDGLRQSETLTSHTQAERHGAQLTTLLAGRDTAPVTVPFYLTPLLLSW